MPRAPLVGQRNASIFQFMMETQTLRKPLSDNQRDLLMITILLLLDGLVIYQHFRLQEAIELLTQLAIQYSGTG